MPAATISSKSNGVMAPVEWGRYRVMAKLVSDEVEPKIGLIAKVGVGRWGLDEDATKSADHTWLRCPTWSEAG